MSFELTEEHLVLLWDLNQFQIPRDRWVFFGLRGCLPVSDQDHSFARSHAVKIEGVDYLHPRCTLGQWQPGRGFALFPGSTIPHRSHVAASRPQGGAGTNQLMTGYYSDYRKGKHKAGSPTAHDAFRQDNKLPIQRSADDADFDADDRVDFEQPFDNLHAAWSHGVSHDSYASAGCQVIVGFPQCAKRDNHPDTGAWKAFKDNAYSIEQTSFPYVLLTGRDAERVVHSTLPMSPKLRYGSKGPLVPLLQQALRKRGFYEGEIDDDFGIRTLRAVLSFQTAEFGPSADDGIVGAQTASALELAWPIDASAVVTAQPAAVTPARVSLPSRGVELDGDHAVAPDGTRFAKRFKKGVFTFGTTSIVEFVRNHRAAFAATASSLVNVIEAVSQNEGKLEAVNTWDDAFMTFGCFQWTAGSGDGRGELGALLDRLKRESSDVFDELFGRHGLDVHSVLAGPPTKPGVTPLGAISLDGELLDTAAKKERVRTLDWAYRFWVAGHHDTVRIVQVKQAMDRVHIFYRSTKHPVNGHSVADYVSSEAGVALLLDQHVNRPGHVPKTLAQAVRQLASLAANPAGWTDDDERKLLHAYIELRAATSMTDSDKRAQAVLEAASRGVVSTRRGSFAA
jgi:Putative peptidoglycan binding domain